MVEVPDRLIANRWLPGPVAIWPGHVLSEEMLARKDAAIEDLL